jgi:tRNA pseudouridine38-40 synthase
VVRQPVELTGAGRTDAGVHAWGQVVSGNFPDGTDLADLERRLNKLCSPVIAVRKVAWAGDGFDARFSASWRHYRYDVWNAPYPNPLIAARSWHVSTPLDVAAMNEAAQHVRGEHDFASFCRRPKSVEGEPEPSLVRNVLSAGWAIADAEGPVLRFEIRANAFCHQMVRSITGTLVDVGSGNLPHDAVVAILAAGDRQAAGQVAPPQGLTLWQVGY